jgi:hypothetical protein
MFFSTFLGVYSRFALLLNKETVGEKEYFFVCVRENGKANEVR